MPHHFITSHKGMKPSDGLPGLHASAFYTTRRYPFYMMVLTKCGCTYLKNLFYYMDFNAPHPLGDRIHADESDLVRGDPNYIDEITQSPYRFFVMREPVSRFWSMYFEKIWGQGPNSFAWFRQDVGIPIGMDFTPDLGVHGHRRNVHLFLEWLALNFAGKTPQCVDFHWRPLIRRYKRVRNFDPILLTLGRLDEQLPQVLGDIVPDIATKMTAVISKNKSLRPYSQREIETADLNAHISSLYPADIKLFQRSETMWADGTVLKRLERL